MSVNGTNKNLKLNIGFQETYKKDIIIDVASIMMQPGAIMPTDPTTPYYPGMKGLEVQQEDKNKYVYKYFEDGSVQTKRLIDPQTKEVLNEWQYDEYGTMISHTINSKDGVETILYSGDEEVHCFFEKGSDIAYSIIRYDDKKRITQEASYNKETGFVENEKYYDPETGKLAGELEYNPKVNNQLLKRHDVNEKYPEAHYENIYDKNNKLTRTNHYNADMKLVDCVYLTDNPLVKKKEYFDSDGNIRQSCEIIQGHEVVPLVTELSENFSAEKIREIDCDNVLSVLKDYQFRNDMLSSKHENLDTESELLEDNTIADLSFDAERPQSENTLLDKIFDNPDKTERKAQVKHIIDALKQKFQMVKSDSAELYCDNKEAIDEGIQYISRRLDLCANMKLSEVKKTIDVAQNMLDNNDLFIDAANGMIDKINYQGSTGDCWLLASINAIAETENGRNFIKNFISVNPDTQDVTVKLNGGKDEYVITQDELLKNGKLSKGDYDLRAVEIAFKRHYSEMTPPKTIDGGRSIEAFEVLTGEEPLMVTSTDLNNPEDTSLKVFDGNELQPLNSNTASQFKNKPLIVMAGESALEQLEKLQPNIAICADAMTSEFESHQYWIRIEGDNVIVKEPHNSKNEKSYTKEEFLDKFNGGLNVMIL